MRRELTFIIVTLALAQAVCAQSHYADLEIDIDNLDYVSIKGNTNYPGLITDSTEQYITKAQGVRTLNIEKEEKFSEYIIKVNFPSRTSISKIETAGTYRIESENGKLSLINFAENEPISITTEYQIKKANWNYLYYLIPIPAALILLYILKKTKSKPKKEKPNLKGLTYRQKKIVELLAEKNNPLTQTEIEQELKLPKSSVSRNIRTLELKGAIEKERTGMSNKIRLKQA